MATVAARRRERARVGREDRRVVQRRVAAHDRGDGVGRGRDRGGADRGSGRRTVADDGAGRGRGGVRAEGERERAGREHAREPPGPTHPRHLSFHACVFVPCSCLFAGPSPSKDRRKGEAPGASPKVDQLICTQNVSVELCAGVMVPMLEVMVPVAPSPGEAHHRTRRRRSRRATRVPLHGVRRDRVAQDHQRDVQRRGVLGHDLVLQALVRRRARTRGDRGRGVDTGARTVAVDRALALGEQQAVGHRRAVRRRRGRGTGVVARRERVTLAGSALVAEGGANTRTKIVRVAAGASANVVPVR